MMTTKNSIYPNNLIKDIGLQDKISMPLSDDVIMGIEYAINQLPENRRWFICQRYILKRTLSEIASEKGISSQAVRQQVVKALRPLKSRYSDYIVNGYNNQREKEVEKILEVNEELMTERALYTNSSRGDINPEDILVDKMFEYGVVSLRTRNVLLREGINLLDDLMFFSIEDIRRFRGLGVKSLEEILALQERYNFKFDEH